MTVPEGLDLVEEEDQITHLLQLEETSNPEDILSKFAVIKNLSNSISALDPLQHKQHYMKIPLNKLQSFEWSHTCTVHWVQGSTLTFS